MSKNIITDSLAIFDSFEELREAQNIFKYTFLLDMQQIENVYSNERVSRYFKIPMNLMGGAMHYWELPTADGRTNFMDCLQWFLNHCRIATLYTVKYLLWKEGEHKVYHGSSILQNEDYIKWYEKFENPDYMPTDYNVYENTISKFFRYDCKGNATKERNMAFAYSLLGKKSGIPLPHDNSLDIPSYNWKLYDHIISNRSFFMRLKDVKHMRLDRFTTLIESYANIATIDLIENNEFDIDDMLLKYQLERYFNGSLFNYIHKNHVEYHNNKDRNINLLGERYLSIMSKFSLLPNVFSRKKFVELAYLAILKENQDKIYFNYFSMPNETTTNLIESIEGNKQSVEKDKHPQGANMAYETWLITIERAIEYLSSVLIPFQEKWFFVWQYTKISDNNKTTDPIEILKIMEKDLEDYIRKNRNDIFESDYSNLDFYYPEGDYPNKETATFYLGLLNEMMNRNNLQNLYKITFSRKYFMPNTSDLTSTLYMNIDFYQRQFRYFKNMSPQRNVEFKNKENP